MFPQAAFHHKIGGCFHLKETFQLRQLTSETNAASPSQPSAPTLSFSEAPTEPTVPPTTASCTLHRWAATASLPLPVEKQGWQRASQQSTSPRSTCEKGFFLHWRDLLAQPSGWHILLSAKAEAGAQCLGRAWFGRPPRGKPQQGCPVAHPVVPPLRAAGTFWGSATHSALIPLGP